MSKNPRIIDPSAPMETRGRYIFAVRYGNYEPPEIDSLWDTIALAEKRAEELAGMWGICKMYVFTSLEEFAKANR